MKCSKTKKKVKGTIEFLADSGASSSFTPNKSDLSDFSQIDDDALKVKTAAAAVLCIKGKGVMFIMHTLNHKGKIRNVISQIPVYYIPGLSLRLLSIGSLLNNGMELRGSSSYLMFFIGSKPLLQFKPHVLGQTLYWLTAQLTPAQSLLAMSSVPTVDYDILHRRFAHPSKDVLRHASGNTQNFPSNLSFPKIDPVCPGCAEGKMTRSSFPLSDKCSKAPFGKIHMDLKEFPILSYNKYKYFILFFDDCTSHG